MTLPTSRVVTGGAALPRMHDDRTKADGQVLPPIAGGNILIAGIGVALGGATGG
ncbi:hypothetical protein P3T40_003074 [Paraburkholderia sp. EB58]|jgi:hypothetical protein|uniref:hypothetical protein n=1 Tax=Paraburkholderia sp. EB58 TaxID=3035125 RepID=UPI003D24190F